MKCIHEVLTDTEGSWPVPNADEFKYGKASGTCRRRVTPLSVPDVTSVTNEKHHDENQLRNALFEQDRDEVGQAARNRVNQREN